MFNEKNAEKKTEGLDMFPAPKVLRRSLINNVPNCLILIEEVRVGKKSQILFSCINYRRIESKFADYDAAMQERAFVGWILWQADAAYRDAEHTLDEIGYISPQAIFDAHHSVQSFDTMARAMTFLAELAAQQSRKDM